MKSELEIEDRKAIAEEVVKMIKPLLANKGKSVDKDNIVDVKGLAEYLKVSDKWVYANIKEMNIPYIKLKGHTRFKMSDITHWINSYNIPAVNRIDRIVKEMKR